MAVTDFDPLGTTRHQHNSVASPHGNLGRTLLEHKIDCNGGACLEFKSWLGWGDDL
jgi:hypothetical protein